ncbi:MAG: hypothetical protein KGJ13_12995, partial [Patescibacteria group bacterium]|nr:hypothetical protein [Patescibacteria group bacterium]
MKYPWLAADEGHPRTQRRRTHPNDGSEPELGFRRAEHPYAWARDEFGWDMNTDFWAGRVLLKVMIPPQMNPDSLLAWEVVAPGFHSYANLWRDATGELAEQVRAAWHYADDAGEGCVLKGYVVGVRVEIGVNVKIATVLFQLRDPVLRY